MTTAIVSQTTSKDAMSILGASDDRELLSQGLDDFLPYDVVFEAVATVQEVKARKNFDNRGVFVSLTINESSDLQNVKPGKTYVIAYFDQHKSIPQFVLGKMAQGRREFAACIAGVPCSDDFKAAPVLLQLHNEVEPLGIKVHLRNKFERTTRTGKMIHALSFALATK